MWPVHRLSCILVTKIRFICCFFSMRCVLSYLSSRDLRTDYLCGENEDADRYRVADLHLRFRTC